MCVCLCVYMSVCVCVHGRVYMCVCACMCTCMHVCPSPRLLIISGVMWTPYDWFNKFYIFIMAYLVRLGIVSRCGLKIYEYIYYANQPNLRNTV